MLYFVACFYIILPLLAALFVSKWFWRIRYLRNLKEVAKTIDEENIPSSSTVQRFKEFRGIDLSGDKIVVVHYFYPWAEDLEDNIKAAFLAVLSNYVKEF